MRAHISNSAYGILDYAAQPAAMLIAAPILIHHLGLAPYGLWLIASAAVSAGSIVTSGFGDAVIQRIATLRSVNDLSGIRGVVANTMAINLILSGVLATIFWLFAPLLVTRISHADPSLRFTATWSLRIGAILILVKSVESVYISAQRAFVHYGPAVRIGIVTRLSSTGAALLLAWHGYGVTALMFATLLLTALGLVAQEQALRRHLGPGLLHPSLDRATATQLASFGCFTWFLALSGVLFSQADRLILGATLGASAVACYGLSVQVAQPIHGLTAAGLHFLFPHLASRFAADDPSTLQRPILIALTINLLSAGFLTAAVLLFGPRLLTLWIDPVVAHQSALLLHFVACGFGLLALNITAHYTLMAIGRIRLVTAVNVAGGLLMLLAMVWLIPSRGVEGAALARLCYGPITCLLYLPLIHLLRAPIVSSPANMEHA